MNEKLCLEITQPSHLADLPILITRGPKDKELICSLQSENDQIRNSNEEEKKYIFVWHQNENKYLKLILDEILWIEAYGSYSKLYLTYNRNMVISFNLATIEKELPNVDFLRIHRSYIINLKYVTSQIGNSLKIEGKLLTIGREYREKFFDRFISLGVRRKDK